MNVRVRPLICCAFIHKTYSKIPFIHTNTHNKNSQIQRFHSFTQTHNVTIKILRFKKNSFLEIAYGSSWRDKRKGILPKHDVPVEPAHPRGWTDDVHVKVGHPEKRGQVEPHTDVIWVPTSLLQHGLGHFNHPRQQR